MTEICPKCQGIGKISSQNCSKSGGTGVIIVQDCDRCNCSGEITTHSQPYMRKMEEDLQLALSKACH